MIDSITTRPLFPAHEDFSYQVYATTRTDEMARTFTAREQGKPVSRL
jgi:hypothetical protein